MKTEQSKFWTVIFLIALGFSVLILAVDFQIKGAILEESTRLRELIGGQTNAGRANNAGDANGSINPAVPNNLQSFTAARMEKAATNGFNSAPTAGRFSPEPPDDGIIPSSNE